MRARDRLPGDRRHEVLRARRDQGRDRLPDRARQPAGRRLVHARRQLAAGAGSGRPRCRACSRHADTMGIRCGRRPPTPEPVPGPRDGGGQGVRALHGHDGGPARRAPRSGSPVGDLLEALLQRDRLPRGARGRAHDRGAGPHREPRGARRGRARVRRRAPRRARTRSTSSCSRSRSSPTPTRAATTRAS